MLESTRLDYLAAMGVTGWVPRQALPNVPFRIPADIPAPEPVEAQEAEVLPASRNSSSTSEVPSSSISSSRAAEVRSRLTGMPRQPEQAEPAPVKATPPVQSLPPLEPFYLQLWIAGPCALLLEVEEPGLESASSELRLLKDILRAVNLPVTPHLQSDFRWPLTRNPQFDRSAPAASLALQAFMTGRLEGQSVLSVGCFGRKTRLLLGTGWDEEASEDEAERTLEGLPPAWFTFSLAELMENSKNKARLWQQLRRIMSRWQVVND